jgi:hypothetical protein
LQAINLVIHIFIHTLWITAEVSTPWDGCEAVMGVLQTLWRDVSPGYVHGINAVLQRFSERRTGMSRIREGGLDLEIAGWRCWLRIYSRQSTEYFGVPVEEFDEAYLSAKSP